MMLAPVSSSSVSEGNVPNSTMSSELEMNRWSVISERGVEANGLNHEEARRLVHRLGGSHSQRRCDEIEPQSVPAAGDKGWP